MTYLSRFALCSFLSLLTVSAWAQTTIAEWTFPTQQSQSSALSRDFGAADLGVLTSGTKASGTHSATTLYETNTGNGGTGYAASAQNWNQNDYFQFTASTVGFTNIKITFDSGVTISTGGVKTYSLYYSTNGTTYVAAAGDTYTLTTSYRTFSFDLSSITGLNNNSAVGFRLLEPSKQNPKGGDTSGTEISVDNFIITGTAAVPELASYAALLGGAALVVVVWRRRRPLASSGREN